MTNMMSRPGPPGVASGAITVVVAFAAVILAACGGSVPGATGVPTPAETRVPSSAPTPAATATPPVRNVWDLQPLGPLPPGAYFVDPDGNTFTKLRVRYDVRADGWSQWTGAAKFSAVGHVGVSITAVVNLVRDGCVEHAWAAPPIGPSVDDLVAGLTTLRPFEVTSAPSDVTVYGFRGKHLELTVPALPVERGGEGLRFVDCIDGRLKSWVAWFDADEPGDAFYGYTGPGYTEEMWILDVEGTRLMIAAERSPGSPPLDLAELDAILDSIQIEP